MIHELDRLLIAARQHQTCSSEEAKIDGDAIVIPFDAHQANGTWTIEYERVRNRRELLEALGY